MTYPQSLTVCLFGLAIGGFAMAEALTHRSHPTAIPAYPSASSGIAENSALGRDDAKLDFRGAPQLSLVGMTAGGDDADQKRSLRPQVHPGDGSVELTWSAPRGVSPARYKLYRTNTPTGDLTASTKELTSVTSSVRRYTDHVGNWKVYYYWVEALDDGGKVQVKSDIAAAVARPPDSIAHVETFAYWFEPYRPTTESNPTESYIGHPEFLVGLNSDAAADLNSLGIGLLPYTTYYQTYNWTPNISGDESAEKVKDKIEAIAFYNPSLNYSKSPAGFAPSVFNRPITAKGPTSRVQYVTCPNSTVFRTMTLGDNKKKLEGGAKGFFIDNGYHDADVANLVCESKSHKHYYGDHLTAAEAFLGLTLETYCEVKQNNKNGILIVNGGVPANVQFYGLNLADVCDGVLWESFLRSSLAGPKHERDDWQTTYTRAVDLEKSPHTVRPQSFVLSYPYDRDEAYFCYATAKLCNLPWAANAGINDPRHERSGGGHFGAYPELNDLRLGKPASAFEYGGTKQGAVYTREYEKGWIVVNPAKRSESATVRFGRSRGFRDAYAKTNGEADAVTVQLPPQSGRVFTWR